MDDTNFHQLLDRIYGAAVDPALWPGVLGALETVTHSHGAVLIRQNEETGVGEGLRAKPLPEATGLYYGYFATRNVFLQADNARAAVKSYRPEVLTDEHKVTKDTLVRSEFYNDFMRRFEFHSVLMVRLAVEGLETVVLNLSRTKRQGGYGNSEIYLANALLPHLSRAFDMGRKIASAKVLTDGLTAAQDNSPHGVFVVEEDGTLRHANAAGQGLLAGQGALRLVAGKLSASTPDRAQRLEGLIRRAASTDPTLRAGGSMTLASPGHGANLLVTVIPAGGEASPVLSPRRSAIVCVSDPDARLGLSKQTLRDLFGLTPAETRVAHGLFDGLTPREMADRFAVSLNTVQNQLCRAFEKTGTHRQAELVRLLTRFVAPPAE